jgi:hypothetical protein
VSRRLRAQSQGRRTELRDLLLLVRQFCVLTAYQGFQGVFIFLLEVFD